MPTRREVLGATGLAGIGGLAGCLDTIPFLGDEPIEFAAAPASVPDSVLDETGYEDHQLDEVVIERTYEAGGRSQDVIVTNHQAEYDKAVDLGAGIVSTEQRLRAAIFTALSTPQVSVLGRTFNPVADMDSAELAEMIQDRYEGIENLRQVGEESATVATASTTVGEFEADAELVEAGATVELTLHIAEAVEAGDDLLVAIGGYPRALQGQEEAAIFTLMDAVEHDG